jgi:hypothetical protein
MMTLPRVGRPRNLGFARLFSPVDVPVLRSAAFQIRVLVAEELKENFAEDIRFGGE